MVIKMFKLTYAEYCQLAESLLTKWGLHNHDFVTLSAMIAAHESHGGKWRRQVGGGPALGIFQIEPPTHNDVWDRSRSIHGNAVKAGIKRDTNRLADSDEYSIFVCRHIVMLDPDPIPNTPTEMARWCKAKWNTEAGKATAEKYLNDWQLWRDGTL